MIMTAGLPPFEAAVNCSRPVAEADAKRGDRIALLVARIQELAAGRGQQAG